MKKEGIQTRNRKLSSKSKKKKGLGGACLPIGSHLGVGVGMSDLMKPLDPSKTFGGGFSASMGMYEIFFASNRFPRSFAKKYSFYIFFTLTEHKSIWSPRFLYSYWLRFLTTPAIYVLMIRFIFFLFFSVFPVPWRLVLSNCVWKTPATLQQVNMDIFPVDCIQLMRICTAGGIQVEWERWALPVDYRVVSRQPAH